MLQRLIELIPRKLAKHGLTKSVLAAQVVTAWPEIVQKVCSKAACSSQAVSLNAAGTLTIRCQHATVAGELALCEDAIIQAYRTLFPGLKITLRFRIGALVNQEVGMLAQ